MPKFRHRHTFFLLVFLVFLGGCSEPHSSARISFKDSVAPASAFGEKTQINKYGSDDRIIKVLNGESTEYSPRRSYDILYGNPMLIASVQCCDNPADAKKAYKNVVDLLGEKNPLGLKSHKDLKMKVPSMGFWNDEPDSPKQIVFRYGNVVMVIQTMFSSAITVGSIEQFADAYVRHLDGVPGAR